MTDDKVLDLMLQASEINGYMRLVLAGLKQAAEGMDGIGEVTSDLTPELTTLQEAIVVAAEAGSRALDFLSARLEVARGQLQ